MSLTIEEVEHIAKLARLELSAEQKALYRQQLSNILDYIAKLRQLDTTAVAPTAGGGLNQMELRPDQTAPGLSTKALLRERTRNRRRSVQDPASLRVTRPRPRRVMPAHESPRPGPRPHRRMTALTDLSLTEMQSGLQDRLVLQPRARAGGAGSHHGARGAAARISACCARKRHCAGRMRWMPPARAEAGRRCWESRSPSRTCCRWRACPARAAPESWKASSHLTLPRPWSDSWRRGWSSWERPTPMSSRWAPRLRTRRMA